MQAVEPRATRAVHTASGRRLYRSALVLVLLLLLPGCVHWLLFGGPNLHALRLERVETVDLQNRPEIWGEARPPHSRPALMVVFSVERDLAVFARRFEYHIGNVASLCREGTVDQDRKISSPSYIYDELDVVDPWRRDRGTPNSEGRFTYRLFVLLSTEAKPDGPYGRPDSFFIDHDLRRDHDDLCFRLRGGAMWGGWFQSNTVTIPYPLIRAALDRAGM